MATGKLYSTGMKHMLDGTIIFGTSNIRCGLFQSTALVGAAYQTVHEYLSSVTAECTNGSGYTTGGYTMANGTVTLAAANSTTIKVDCDDAVWTAATISARYATVYKWGTASTDSPLVAYVDFASSQTSSNGTFTVAWSTAGMFTINVA
jgi:hypothetical protein